jgi:hypothetical protein
MASSEKSISFQDRAFSALVNTVAVPMARLADATGLTPRLFQTFKGAIANKRLSNNFGTYQPDEHDILVCTFPKSGTNWMMQIAYQIIHRGMGDFEHVHQYMPWPDAMFPIEAQLDNKSIAARSPFAMRVIKTHLSGAYLPYTPQAKYICILRDPKDVLVSSYFFIRDVALGVLMPSVESWYKMFITDSFMLGSWAENLHDYWQLRHCPNVMVVTFEQMKTDHIGVVRQVVDFLGIDLTETEIQMVYEKSTFSYMKTVDYKFDPPPATPLTAKGAKMIRKGTSGGSSELLTLEQQQCIDDYCRAELRRLGSDFPYDAMFTLA